MRPLFWNRIQVPVDRVPSEDVRVEETSKSPAMNESHLSGISEKNPQATSSSTRRLKSLWEDLEEIKLKDEKLDEFCQLFKRTVTANTHILKKAAAQKTKEAVSILDPKRAHTINILITSRHLRIKDIKNTVYNLDMSIIDVETLKQIHEIAGTDDEIQAIDNFMSTGDHAELGKAEQFIFELSKIDHFNDRFKCIMFEVWSNEQMQTIESKLNNFQHMCEVLMKSESIQHILSIILALGNYMNGGNRDRGQADGFGLEILPKLRDVKSATSSSITLLHYIVQTYIQTHIPNGIVSFDEVKKPLPEIGDLEQASIVVLDDIDQDLKGLQEQIENCEKCADRIVSQHQEPFKSHMKVVFSKISKEYQNQRDNLLECRQIFSDIQEFYCWRPKTQQPIREFFNCWIPFCRDFQSIFKNEILRRIKTELDNVRAKVTADKKARTKDIKTSKVTPSGLKAKLKAKVFFERLRTSDGS